MCFHEPLDLPKDRGNVLEKLRVCLMMIIANWGPCGALKIFQRAVKIPLTTSL